MLRAWPYFLAYVVSFLTIGAGWLAHTAMTGGYLAAILIGLIVPGVAVAIYFSIAGYMLLFRVFKRRPHAER